MACPEDGFNCPSNRDQRKTPFCIYKGYVSAQILPTSLPSCLRQNPTAMNHWGGKGFSGSPRAVVCSYPRKQYSIPFTCQCQTNVRVHSRQVCDSDNDCEGGEDEMQPECERPITPGPTGRPDIPVSNCTDEQYKSVFYQPRST